MATGDLSAIRIEAVGLTPNPIEAGKGVLVSVQVASVTSKLVNIPVSAWVGQGPYHMDLSSNLIGTSTEASVAVDCTATVEQRMDEYNAGLSIGTVSAGTVRLTAINRRPRLSLPVRIVSSRMPLLGTFTVPSSAWTGSGPWTATVNVGRSISTAFVGASEDVPNGSAEAMVECGVHMAGAAGSTATLRAMFQRPTADLTVTIGGM